MTFGMQTLRNCGSALLTTVAVIAIATVAAGAAGLDQKLHDAVPAEYQTNGVNVAVFNDWPPDEFIEGGELKGWSVDMAKAMSEKLGVEFKLVGTSFDVIIPGLVSKRFDAGFSSFGVTEERLQSLDFVPQRSEPRVSTRIRLAEPQNVLAVAEMNDGALLMTRTWVEVATNGCT